MWFFVRMMKLQSTAHYSFYFIYYIVDDWFQIPQTIRLDIYITRFPSFDRYFQHIWLILIYRLFCLKQHLRCSISYGQELYTWESGFGFGIVSDGGEYPAADRCCVFEYNADVDAGTFSKSLPRLDWSTQSIDDGWIVWPFIYNLDTIIVHVSVIDVQSYVFLFPIFGWWMKETVLRYI